MRLNINTEATRAFTNKLEKLHKSALPLAIRGTLNNAAFDVKQKTMLKSASEHFTQRRPTFFKAKSRVSMAGGWDVEGMRATVGFTGNEQAVEDLEKQEHGGKIKGRSFIPMKEARGGNNAKPVRPKVRMGAISNVVNSNNVKGSSRKQKFVKSAIHVGKGGFVIGNFENQRLYQIVGLTKGKGGTKIKTKAIYSYEKGRSVRVKATGFMSEASLKSANKMDMFYRQQAEKQIKRLT